nr:hypothetical protein [Komagataeibacter europaeus]
MLDVVPRQFRVIQMVRKKVCCSNCESITQPPAPCHPLARSPRHGCCRRS